MFFTNQQATRRKPYKKAVIPPLESRPYQTGITLPICFTEDYAPLIDPSDSLMVCQNGAGHYWTAHALASHQSVRLNHEEILPS